MKIKTTILLMIGLTVFATSCGDSNGKPDPNNTSTGLLSDSDKAKLYDKVWYPTASAGGINQEWLSEGEYRQALSLSGSWSWQNNGDTMNITDYSGKKFKYIFDAISNSTIIYRHNIGGDNFKTSITFSSNP